MNMVADVVAIATHIRNVLIPLCYNIYFWTTITFVIKVFVCTRAGSNIN